MGPFDSASTNVKSWQVHGPAVSSVDIRRQGRTDNIPEMRHIVDV
jgi:hypothetical protein